MSVTTLPLPGSERSRRVIKKRSQSAKTESAPVLKNSITVSRLASVLDSWILDCQAARASQARITNIRYLAKKLPWWCSRERITIFDAEAIRGFFLYIQTAHNLPEGRWGEEGLTRDDHLGKSGCPAVYRYRPVTATTLSDYTASSEHSVAGLSPSTLSPAPRWKVFENRFVVTTKSSSMFSLLRSCG
jgi:hypothetical protein